MIKLSFFINREIFYIRIDGKSIFYKDRKQTKETKLLPLTEEQIRKHKEIGIKSLFDEAGEKEYEEAQTEEEIAEIIVKDCKKNGLKLIKREKI